MYHVISLIVVFVSFSNRISAQTYASATCNGEICALLSGDPTIRCTTGGSEVDFTPYVVTPPVGGNSEPIFKSAAVNPIDGEIYILFVLNGGDGTTYLGTIPDPSTDTAPFNITRIGDVGLTADEYTALTFDCEGNAYGMTVGNEPEITQIDITTGTDTVVDQILADQTCHKFVECYDVFTYDYDAGYFLRISTAPGIPADEVPPRLFIRQDIEGPDIQDNENGTIIDYNGKCDDGRAIYAFSYIGNGIALIYCQDTDSAHILDLSDINNPIVQDAPFPLADDNTFGLFNYNSDGSICRPLTCTPAPTTAAMTTTFGGSSSDSDSDTDSGSSAANDSDSGSDSGDGAEVAQNIQDMGFENTKKMSGAIIVDLSEKSVLHLWGLFAAFSVVNIIACWCVFKRDVKNLRVVTTKPPLIDL